MRLAELDRLLTGMVVEGSLSRFGPAGELEFYQAVFDQVLTCRLTTAEEFHTALWLVVSCQPAPYLKLADSKVGAQFVYLSRIRPAYQSTAVELDIEVLQSGGLVHGSRIIYRGAIENRTVEGVLSQFDLSLVGVELRPIDEMDRRLAGEQYFELAERIGSLVLCSGYGCSGLDDEFYGHRGDLDGLSAVTRRDGLLMCSDEMGVVDVWHEVPIVADDQPVKLYSYWAERPGRFQARAALQAVAVSRLSGAELTGCLLDTDFPVSRYLPILLLSRHQRIMVSIDNLTRYRHPGPRALLGRVSLDPNLKRLIRQLAVADGVPFVDMVHGKSQAEVILLLGDPGAVSYTHLTLPTNREV